MINFSDCWIFFTRNRVLSSSNGFKFFFSFFQFSLFFLFSVFFPFLSTCCRLDRGSFNLFYIIKLLSVKMRLENRFKKGNTTICFLVVQLVKFKYSEKATKFEKISHLVSWGKNIFFCLFCKVFQGWIIQEPNIGLATVFQVIKQFSR